MCGRWFALTLLLAGSGPGAAAPDDHSFERELFKTRFEQKVKFCAAAIEVAWAAKAVCAVTTQVEPFVLLSVHAMRRRFDARGLALLREATGMDEKWRVVWADEGAPAALHLRDVVTQKGCAGSVTASAWDNDPDTFWRQGTQRVEIPANAMVEARTHGDFRWLAAFGTYFQASQGAIQAWQRSEGVSTGFLVGKVLALALLGGDAAAGLRLTERLLARGIQANAVMMDGLRRSNAAHHAERIRATQAALAAAVERDREQTRVQNDAERRRVLLQMLLPLLT